MRCHFPCLFKMLFSLIWQADLFSICYDVNWRSTKNLIRSEEIGLLCSLHSTWYQLMVSLPLAIWYLTESAQQTPQYQFVQSKFMTAAQCAIVKETFRYSLGRVKAVFFIFFCKVIAELSRCLWAHQIEEWKSTSWKICIKYFSRQELMRVGWSTHTMRRPFNVCIASGCWRSCINSSERIPSDCCSRTSAHEWQDPKKKKFFRAICMNKVPGI